MLCIDVCGINFRGWFEIKIFLIWGAILYDALEQYVSWLPGKILLSIGLIGLIGIIQYAVQGMI